MAQNFFVLFCFFFVIGMNVPPPENLKVNILDGEVTVFWENPVNASSDFVYNVEMARYVSISETPLFSKFSHSCYYLLTCYHF